ncbi:DUF397 domain-containing protein [Amycolatopsis sp. NPDC059021]|uniref:DUF397 domain-containing protein n=1 Tax=Amycolatopsis sp. NPDC059021 TaxID=3346704 RepID=UPI00366E2301
MRATWITSSYSGSHGDCVEVALGTWVKSSHSGNQGNCVEVALDTWAKSSYSGGEGNCVEVAMEAAVGIRDTKDRPGGQLTVSHQAWSAALASLRRG